MTWKTISKKTLLNTGFFKITEENCIKHNKKIVRKFFTINRPDVAIIAAFLKPGEKTHSLRKQAQTFQQYQHQKIILIRQYRHAVKSTDYEIQAGYIEPKEKNITSAAKRELLEETGYKAEKIIKIAETYSSAGLMTNKTHFFIALNAEKTQDQKLDPDEEIEVKITSWQEAIRMLEKGKIKDMGSITGILLAQKFLKNINKTQKKLNQPK